MKTKMLVDFNESVKKGDPAPKGREAHFVKIGLAEKVAPPPPPSPSAGDCGAAAQAKDK